MPSDLPIIRVRTEADNIIKIKTVAKYNNRSVSKEMEKLMLDHIAEFEREHGKIEIEQMSIEEIVKDIRDRVQKKPPYPY